MILAIIGGGASGMAAALAAAENPDVQVHIFERQARVGRKLLATGNGRCNLTNLNAGTAHYHGENPAFAETALQAMPPEAVLQWFRRLGLFTVAEDSGRVYPYSDQANSVVDVLRLALQKENITLHAGFEVEKIYSKAPGFVVGCGEQIFSCDRLIIACGGLAGTKLGGSMSGYKLLSKLGHRATRLRPALVQLKTAWPGIAALKGVRTNCRAEIYRDDALFSRSVGEIQFTDYGISGPVVFEISRDVCQSKGDWRCRLDFVPDASRESLADALNQRRATNLSCEDLLTGIVHNRLGKVLVKAADIRGNDKVSDLADSQLEEVLTYLKAFEISLTEPLGMDSAQVTAGGVLTDTFDPATLESKLVPGLYACGEVLDIDGDCGGYNLQWAWSSGICAGRAAGEVKL